MPDGDCVGFETSYDDVKVSDSVNLSKSELRKNGIGFNGGRMSLENFGTGKRVGGNSDGE